MDITILFDKDSGNANLHAGWGVSFLIGGKVLFDTGEKGSWLMQNMEKLNINLGTIEAIVLSHEHWDHTGGLLSILEKRQKMPVYVCPHFSTEFKNNVKSLKGNVVEAKKVTEIADGIFTTGEIAGKYKERFMPEQAVAVRTDKGISVITGCAHPGIVRIVDNVEQYFSGEDFYIVLGGFHLKDKSEDEINGIVNTFKEKNIQKVAPAHCTGISAVDILEETYNENFIPVRVGETIIV